MAKRPKLDELDYLFEQGADFRLSGKLYEEKTGATLPKGKNYLKNQSALSAKAKEKGYVIVDVEEQAVIEKTVVFKKKEG